MQVFCLPNAHNKCNKFRVYRYFQVIIVYKIIIIQQLNMNEMPILSYWLQSIYYYQHCKQISFSLSRFLNIYCNEIQSQSCFIGKITQCLMYLVDVICNSTLTFHSGTTTIKQNAICKLYSAELCSQKIYMYTKCTLTDRHHRRIRDYRDRNRELKQWLRNEKRGWQMYQKVWQNLGQKRNSC